MAFLWIHVTPHSYHMGAYRSPNSLCQSPELPPWMAAMYYVSKLYEQHSND